MGIETATPQGDPRAKDATAFGVGLARRPMARVAAEAKGIGTGKWRSGMAKRHRPEVSERKDYKPEPTANDAGEWPKEPEESCSRRCRITPELSRAAKRLRLE